MKCRHTGANIANEIDTILKAFGILKKNVVGGTTDSGGNMINGMKAVLASPECHNICICHLLATIIRHVMARLAALFPCVDKVQGVGTHLKHSTSSMELFRECQEEEGASENDIRYLKTSVVTRWNSAYKSVMAYLSLKQHVDRTASSELYKGPAPINSSEAKILEDFVLVMKPFYIVTNELSGENYVTGIIL